MFRVRKAVLSLVFFPPTLELEGDVKAQRQPERPVNMRVRHNTHGGGLTGGEEGRSIVWHGVHIVTEFRRARIINTQNARRNFQGFFCTEQA